MHKIYSINNIANCDETALFYKVLPNKILHLKGEKCSIRKFFKERITLLLIVFADGTFKKLVVIGKSRSPRCFKRLDKNKFLVTYYANNKAWMTITIFTKILRNLNEKMRKENRSILLFLDNATCHPKI